MKRIPKKYMWKGEYGKGGYRHNSPYRIEIENLYLDQIPCPKCGEKHLRNGEFGNYSEFPIYCVVCDNCGWQCNSEFLSDCGESISVFKNWLEAFELLGKPKKLIDEDVSLLLYPEEWRNKIIAELQDDAEKSYKYNRFEDFDD